ncbi:MAG: hypothetical protein NTV09_06545, partial [Bacteroidetes bacterium]|nr:hypothetical protein [Bacteroidota bacterium]
YAYSSKNLIVAQELIDFYNTPPSKPLADFVYSAQTGPTYYYWFYQGIVYNGEYQIDLSNIPWGNQSRVSPGIDINNFLISYEIEAVSFPFSLDCAFPNSTYPDGNCGYGNTRELIMPEDNYYNSNSNSWDYPLTSQISTNKLSRYVLQTGTRPDINSWMSSPNSLVSSTFEGGGVGNDRNALPHTILKHTIRLHCGTSLTGSPIINSFSFLLDHTRGKMREYPFTSSNTPGGIATHDIVIKPELWMLNSDYSKTENCEAYSIPSNIINQCSAVWGSILGGTLDYQPYNEIDDNDCTVLSYVPVNNPANSFTVDAYTADRLPIAPFTFILSTFPRISYGEALAGYSNDGTNLNSKVTPGQEMVHKYFIDKYIDLSRINPIEKVIYNRN